MSDGRPRGRPAAPAPKAPAAAAPARPPPLPLPASPLSPKVAAPVIPPTVAPRNQAGQARQAAPPVQAVQPAEPAPPAAPAAIEIPVITFSSAPPPMPPLMSTAPPPPVTAPPPALTEQEREALRARVDEARRMDDLRNEARAILHDAMAEALAPVHHALRELERRVEQLEERPIVPPAAAPSPRRVAVASAALRADPFMAAPARAVQATAASGPAPHVSVDLGEVPFSGARQRRKVVLLFSLLLFVIFGGLFSALALSYMH